MSVIKRLFSFFLLILTLLLLQHAISCRIKDNYNSKVTSQSYRSANYAYQRLHLRSVAKTVVKKSVPAQDYLSTILLASVLLIAHLKFDFANIFFAITHIPVYRWQLARCGLSEAQTIVLKTRYNKKNKCLRNVFLYGRRCNMDYKKEIIEMIQKIHSESMIKFIYGCVKRAYKEERVGK